MWALQEACRHPGRTFWRWELEDHSLSDWTRAVNDGFLRYRQPPGPGAVYTAPDGRRLKLFVVDDEVWGSDEDDESRVERLNEETLHRYDLRLEPVAHLIAKRSQLAGRIDEISPNCYWLGEWATPVGEVAAVLLLAPSTRLVETTLLALRLQLPTRYYRLAVAVPLLELGELAVRRLNDAGVWPVALPGDFAMDSACALPTPMLPGAQGLRIEVRDADESVRVNGVRVSLTGYEFVFLRVLIGAKDDVVHHDNIARAIWGHVGQLDQLSKYAKAVRTKLAKGAGRDPEEMKRVIESKPRVGYRLNLDVCQANLIATPPRE